jgi:hypothetical protein
MKCRDCKFLGERKFFGDADEFGSVHCTLGVWDKPSTFKTGHPIWQWYARVQVQINRGPVKKLGESCTQGEPKEKEVARRPYKPLVQKQR